MNFEDPKTPPEAKVAKNVLYVWAPPPTLDENCTHVSSTWVLGPPPTVWVPFSLRKLMESPYMRINRIPS
jgi:hypothetical protein